MDSRFSSTGDIKTFHCASHLYRWGLCSCVFTETVPKPSSRNHRDTSTEKSIDALWGDQCGVNVVPNQLVPLCESHFVHHLPSLREDLTWALDLGHEGGIYTRESDK